AELVFDDLRATAERGTPVVLCMWERPDDPPDLPCVAVDFRLAGALAAQHLLELGHTRVGALVGSKGHDQDKFPCGIHGARRDGFVATFNAAGVGPVVTEFICESDTIRGGYDAARQLLEAHPEVTAIFATNDLPALGAMHAAADLGLSVPEDLSVIGITDIQLARESRPALSTVAVPTEEAARMAVDLLRQLIERAQREERVNPGGTSSTGAAGPIPMCVTSAPVLVPRASTAPPRRVTATATASQRKPATSRKR
ncbi:MAG TPA: substrate-binding domain-containing protein, partial [Paraburkholderia sp.]|nr:substrate-binding domain-containing protein [Paraburkholderia sp.]